ncbi:unnamed protein product [Linum trigynum]|uniref:Uncharacterized protein n=1 Tax=Linum trigynum TaxID=586398 RepID=A0AAV2CKZ1_9ROSI
MNAPDNSQSLALAFTPSRKGNPLRQNCSLPFSTLRPSLSFLAGDGVSNNSHPPWPSLSFLNSDGASILNGDGAEQLGESRERKGAISIWNNDDGDEDDDDNDGERADQIRTLADRRGAILPPPTGFTWENRGKGREQFCRRGFPFGTTTMVMRMMMTTTGKGRIRSARSPTDGEQFCRPTGFRAMSRRWLPLFYFCLGATYFGNWGFWELGADRDRIVRLVI